MKRNSFILISILMVFGMFFAIKPSYGSVDELRVAIDYDMNGVDPATIRAHTDRILVANIFNGLLKFKPASCEIEKDLAETYEVSRDGKVFTFKLREGVKFHKGYGELTSAEVKFSIMRHLDPEVKSTELRNYSVVDRVEAPDRYTVKIFMKKPSMGFLGILAYHSGGIVSEKAVKELGSKFASEPIGTGAFQWGGRIPGAEIVLDANQSFFLGSPRIKKIVLKIIPDSSVSVNAVQKGEIDYYHVQNIGAYRSLLQIKERNFEMMKYRTTLIDYAWLNCEIEPTKQLKVRQAMAHAIDMNAIVRSFQGMLEPNPSVFPFALPSWTDKLATYKYDVELAKKLLKEAGYERPHIKIVYPKAMNYEDEAIMIKDYLSKIMNVDLVMVDLANWLKVAVERKTWNIYVMAPTRPTEELYASGFFHSKASYYGAGYVNSELDDIIEKADQVVDTAKRKALYVRLQEIMASNLPLLVIGAGNGVAIRSKKLEGVMPESNPGISKFYQAFFK
jgi:peptide/nickel transport system substrate-binding protein